MIRTGKSLPVLMLTAALSACSHVVHVPPPILQPPLVEKLPTTIGVFYSEDLRHHKCVADKGYIAEAWRIQLGPASIEMFDLILGAFYENVVQLDAPDSAFARNFNNVMSVRLLDYNGCEAGWPIFRASIEVAYEATLHGENSAITATWQGRGRAVSGDTHEGCNVKGLSFDVEGSYLGTMTCIAMRMAAADFIIKFNKDARACTYKGK